MRTSLFQIAMGSLLFLFALSRPVWCQISGEGIPTGAPQVSVPLGFVNAMNGNLHLEIPIASIPQRNNDPLIAKYVYDNYL
jgi:hypothetical protein